MVLFFGGSDLLSVFKLTCPLFQLESSCVTACILLYDNYISQEEEAMVQCYGNCGHLGMLVQRSKTIHPTLTL